MIPSHATIVVDVNHVIFDANHIVDTSKTWHHIRLLSLPILHVMSGSFMDSICILRKEAAFCIYWI